MPLTKPLTWALRNQYVFIHLALTFIVLAVLIGSDLSTRRVSAILGVLCLGGLAHRMIGYWGLMTRLELALGLLLATTVVIAAIGTYHLDQVNAPPSGVVWWIIGHRVFTLMVCSMWPILIGSPTPRRAAQQMHPAHKVL